MPTISDVQADALAQQVVAENRLAGLEAKIAELEAGRSAGSGLPPAIPASGAHYSPRGAYEGYADYGFQPVMYQREPYATAAWRAFAAPNGQLGVQPLIGFPSAYPHVIQYPGNDPFYAMPLLNAFAQSLWSNLPLIPPQGRGGGVSRGGTVPGSTAPANTAPANTAPTVGTNMRGDPYEPDGVVYPPLGTPQPVAAPAQGAPWSEPSLSYMRPWASSPNPPSNAFQAAWDGLFGENGYFGGGSSTPQEKPAPTAEQPGWFERARNWLFPRDPRLAEIEERERRAQERVNLRFGGGAGQTPVPQVPPAVPVPQTTEPMMAPPPVIAPSAMAPQSDLRAAVNQLYGFA